MHEFTKNTSNLNKSFCARKHLVSSKSFLLSKFMSLGMFNREYTVFYNKSTAIGANVFNVNFLFLLTIYFDLEDKNCSDHKTSTFFFEKQTAYMSGTKSLKNSNIQLLNLTIFTTVKKFKSRSMLVL